MLFVLEGCDGAGKSTIAQNLKEILPDAEIIHCTADTPNNLDFFRHIIEAAASRNIIADRFCYGQFVYQNPDERQLDYDDLAFLETEMIAHAVRVIHVVAPVEEIRNRLALRGEKTDLSVEEICDRFLNLFEKDTLIKPYIWWTGNGD